MNAQQIDKECKNLQSTRCARWWMFLIRVPLNFTTWKKKSF